MKFGTLDKIVERGRRPYSLSNSVSKVTETFFWSVRKRVNGSNRVHSSNDGTVWSRVDVNTESRNKRDL